MLILCLILIIYNNIYYFTIIKFKQAIDFVFDIFGNGSFLEIEWAVVKFNNVYFSYIIQRATDIDSMI